MKTLSAVLLTTILFSAAAFAQGPPPPAPELKKLDYFVGNWSMDGDLKPGPMGPGGKATGTAKYEWLDGNYFLTAHSNFMGAMGSGTDVAYFGYDSKKKVYTYDAFSSMGQHETATGTYEGDTLLWSFEDDMGMGPMKGHFIMKTTSPTSYNYKMEVSQDGANWATVLEGKATKK